MVLPRRDSALYTQSPHGSRNRKPPPTPPMTSFKKVRETRKGGNLKEHLQQKKGEMTSHEESFTGQFSRRFNSSTLVISLYACQLINQSPPHTFNNRLVHSQGCRRAESYITMLAQNYFHSFVDMCFLVLKINTFIVFFLQRSYSITNYVRPSDLGGHVIFLASN